MCGLAGGGGPHQDFLRCAYELRVVLNDRSGGYSLATAFGVPLHVHCSHQSVAPPREPSCPFFCDRKVPMVF